MQAPRSMLGRGSRRGGFKGSRGGRSEPPPVAPTQEPESKYLPQLLAEKDSLDPSFTHAMKLLSTEIEKVQKGDKKDDDEADTYLDLFSHKNMKLKERILIPVKQYPKFNFVGKILGPQGNTIKRLQEETGAKISVLGKGSMRDKGKEEDLRKGGDPKYAHLNMDLHVFIEVFGPPCEAYTRMSHAMEEVKKFLIPDGMVQWRGLSRSSHDMMDDICQDQFLELSYLNGAPPESSRGRGGPPTRGRGALPPPPPAAVSRGRGLPPPRGALGPRGAPPGRGGPLPRGGSAGRGVPPSPSGRGMPSTRSRPPGIQRIPLPPPPAAEPYNDYGYEDTYAEQSYEGYEGYYSQGQGDTAEYYDYAHGETPESYDSYGRPEGQDDWNSSRPLKAPPARPVKGSYRDHPYGRY